MWEYLLTKINETVPFPTNSHAQQSWRIVEWINGVGFHLETTSACFSHRVKFRMGNSSRPSREVKRAKKCHFSKRPFIPNTCIVLKIVPRSAAEFQPDRFQQTSTGQSATEAPKFAFERRRCARRRGTSPHSPTSALWAIFFLFFLFFGEANFYAVRKTHRLLQKQALRSRCAAVWLAYASTWCNHQEQRPANKFPLLLQLTLSLGKEMPLK